MLPARKEYPVTIEDYMMVTVNGRQLPIPENPYHYAAIDVDFPVEDIKVTLDGTDPQLRVGVFYGDNDSQLFDESYEFEMDVGLSAGAEVIIFYAPDQNNHSDSGVLRITVVESLAEALQKKEIGSAVIDRVKAYVIDQHRLPAHARDRNLEYVISLFNKTYKISDLMSDKDAYNAYKTLVQSFERPRKGRQRLYK